MRRLCFLAPDVASAHSVADDLRPGGIADANLYVVAREGTPLGDLPDAGATDAGHVLIMVDTATDRVADIERIVRTRHPEVAIEGCEPRTPLLPR